MLPKRNRNILLTGIIFILLTFSHSVAGLWCFVCDTNIDSKCGDPVNNFSTNSTALINSVNNSLAVAVEGSNRTFAFSAASYLKPSTSPPTLMLAEVGPVNDYCTSQPSITMPNSTTPEVICRYDPGALRLVDCDYLFSDQLSGRSTICQKIVQSAKMANKDTFSNVIRTCAIKPSDQFQLNCVSQRSVDGSVSSTQCSCNSNACNQAGSSSIRLFAVFYMLLFAAVVTI